MVVTENVGHFNHQKGFLNNRYQAAGKRFDSWSRLQGSFSMTVPFSVTGTENIRKRQVIWGQQSWAQFTQGNKRLPEIKLLKSVHCVINPMARYPNTAVSGDSTGWGSPVIPWEKAVWRNHFYRNHSTWFVMMVASWSHSTWKLNPMYLLLAIQHVHNET